MGELKIVFTHRDFYIIEKPAGISFHSESGAGFVVIAERQLGEKLYSVHRLDKVTSGLLLLARSAQAAAALSGLFEKRDIDKFYLAVSEGKPKKKQGWVKGDMAKSRRGTYKLLTSTGNPAVTRFYSNNLIPGYRAFILKPFSGKTHQLRVALKSLGTPILGDTAYGASVADRVYLHAFALAFEWHGERIEAVSMPEHGQYFETLCENQEIMDSWQMPWTLQW